MFWVTNTGFKNKEAFKSFWIWVGSLKIWTKFFVCLPRRLKARFGLARLESPHAFLFHLALLGLSIKINSSQNAGSKSKSYAFIRKIRWVIWSAKLSFQPLNKFRVITWVFKVHKILKIQRTRLFLIGNSTIKNTVELLNFTGILKFCETINATKTIEKSICNSINMFKTLIINFLFRTLIDVTI